MPIPMNARVLVVDDSATVRKVVQAILSGSGYAVLASGDGQDALQLLEREPVDLVLLDFVMPRMNGYQFCRELRAREGVRDLPVVLMSAKAERIRDQFLRQTGAVDAITKPFEPRALVAVVEGALQRMAEGRAPQVPAAEDMPEEALLSLTNDSFPPSSLPAPGPCSHAELAQALVDAIGTDLTAALQDGRQADHLRGVIESALASKGMPALLQRLRWSLAPGTDEVLVGDVESIPIGEIMQLLQMQRQTGVLEISSGKVVVLVHLRDGLVDLAQCRHGDPELLLGRYFLERQLLSGQDLEIAVRDAETRGELLGARLVGLGLVTQQDLTAALTRQTSEIIYEALRWKRGRFLLRRDVRTPEAENAALALPIASIVMEGFRRVDEWRLIEETIRFEEVLLRDDVAISALKTEQLTAQEHAVLAEIDGKRRVREIIEQSHQSSFDICKTFYRLLKSRLVRRKAA